VPHKEILYAVTSSSSTIISQPIPDDDLQRKINLVTESLPTSFCRLVLSDRDRISKENAQILTQYVLSMKREINPRPSYIKNTIQFLSELSKYVGKKNNFEYFTSDDLVSYLDSCRKPESDDPMHKWIGSYNVKCQTILRFYKWIYYRDIEDPKKRNELSKLERKPECIRCIRQLKRKEISCYKPSDLWTQEDDKLFLKWVTNVIDAIIQ
jgi:integrase/recombinase XerD